MKKYLSPLFSGLFLCLAISCSNDNSTDDDQGGTNDDDGTVVVDKSGNLLATGASANDILSNGNFDRLLIEIGHVAGFSPTQATVNAFQDYLTLHTFKENIDIEFLELPSPDEETLTLQQIADLEEENRTAYNDGSTLAIYIYFADAPSDGDEEDEGLVTLGAVYRNTSMVIYESTIRNLIPSGSAITLTDVETATLNHEFGHLFGLVNLGTVPVNDHEDPDAENHCVIEGCLMRGELQFGAPSASIMGVAKMGALPIQSDCSLHGSTILKILELQNNRGLAVVPELDAECRLDLENNGGKPIDVSAMGF